MKIRNKPGPIDLIHALIAKHVGWVWILLPVYILAWVFFNKKYFNFSNSQPFGPSDYFHWM
jgi:hypothetical protein